MTRSFFQRFQRCALVVGAAAGVFGTPAAARAQKALVYCPVSIDATGCNAIVTALTGSAYPLGVDRGYDGTNGTVDLKTVDLFTYSVFVVPSLADGSTSQPYAKLRDAEVVEHLKAALIGRIAMWSGTPDQGATNRALKDALIQNLAAWAGGAFQTAKGPGLVTLLDASSSAVARYDWVRAITPVPVTADANLLIYDGARALDSRGTGILTSSSGAIAYTNLATFGFQVPNGAPGVSLDAVGQTGTSQGGQVILLTVDAGNTGSAVVRTDKDDYAPGQTVTITGSGWQAGETVKLTLHMDPLRASDTELTATADGNGNFTNTDFAPQQYDVGVRFVLTATGQASGLRAQTTFTDATKLKTLSASPATRSIAAGSSTTYLVALEFNGNGSCTAGLSITTALPAGVSATFSPATLTGTATESKTSTLAITTTAATPTGSTTFTVLAQGTGGGGGGNDCGASDQATVTATLEITAAANVAPSLTGVPSSPQSIPELTQYTFDANATDPGAPPQTLTFSLVGAPSGAAIDPTTGVFTWTPTENQGPGSFTFSVRVSDGVANTDQSLTLNVAEVNSAPAVAPIIDKTVNEGSLLSFTATAADFDSPANGLSFSLQGTVPPGAAITAGGDFTWTPTEAQGPGTYTITVRATDNGAPPLFGEATFQVTVSEVNTAPVLTGVPTTATIAELDPYTFDANATDADTPAQTLTFSLDGAPTGSAIDPSTGVFTWTPSEAQGPNSYTFTVRVSDGITIASQSVTLTVTEVNAAPVLGSIGNQTVNEEAALTFTATATDADLPAQTLQFSLIGAPAGATITPTGAFSWTPTEAQGPGSFTFKVSVSDGSLTDDEEITVTVNEVNKAPTVAAIADKTVDELTLLTFSASASDLDVPSQTLTYSLVGAPAGATIDASTGAFSWTPTEAQGPGVYTFQVRATDNGTPAMSGDALVKVTVNEVNVAPTLASIGNKSINEEALLTFTAVGNDTDLPANTLAYSLVGTVPAGAAIDPSSGVFTWTPTEAQGPSANTFKVRVSDGTLSAEEQITVTVNEVNKAPVVDPITDKTVNEKTAVTFTATATDADVPANTLAFSLDGAPAGASINPSTGAFSWTPTEAQGPGTYTFKVRATDDGTPALFGETTVKVTVNEVNEAPVLGSIGNKDVNEETALTFTATATDPDVPANSLTFSLVGAPATATINASSGAFSWTPTEADGPGTFTFKVVVTDNGSPALADFEEITVTVKEVNRAPVVAPIAPVTVNEGSLASFTANATDPDVPANTVAYSLGAGAPAGASINASTGAFTWTPSEAQGPGTFTFDVVATDNGSPVLSGTASVTIYVKEVNEAPVLAPIGNKTVNEETPLTFTASASDPDLPANTLTYSLEGAPAGASIDGATGAFSWTPTEAQGPGSYTFTVKVTDNGVPNLNDTETITVTVSEVNVAPILGGIGNRTVDEEATLSFTATATDADLPANALSFSLVNGPAGASIDPTSGAFMWVPTEAQGPGNYTFKVRVTDNGAGSLFDEEEITVTVNEVNKEPVLAPIGPQSVNELAALTFTASATDPDTPANTLTYSLVGTVPAGATINPSTGKFYWTPTEAQGPGTFPITVRVTDNGAPNLSDEEQITVTVAEVNQAPVLGAIGPKSTNWGNPLTFTATAADGDIPANTLTFSLDAGAPAGATIDGSSGAFAWTPAAGQVGSFPITVRVKDNGSPSLDDYETITVTVDKRATTLVYSGATSGQYSDPATMTATLTDNGNGPQQGSAIAGKTVTFSITGTSLTLSTPTNGTGVASGPLTLNGPPGSYSVASSFAGDAAYKASYDSDPFAITQEDARADYTGALFASTGSGSSTTVTLSATIRDITAVDPTQSPPNPDNAFGDIRNAKVTFYNRDTNLPITGCTNLPVGLVNVSDTKTGTATCNWVANIGSLNADDFTIGVIVSGHYVRNSSDDNTVVTVSKSGTGFITGGGYLVMQTSAGQTPGGAGTKMNFGFNVKNNKSGSSLQGHVNIIVRNGGRVYQIKSNSITSLTTNVTGPTTGTASFNGKANIQDITNPLSPIPVDGNGSLVMALTDAGEPGSSDQLAVTLFNKDGGVWFVSKWDGVKALQQLLQGGNLQVR